MKILVIGGSRFIGKALVDQFISEGEDVTVANRHGITAEQKKYAQSLILDRNNFQSLKDGLGNEYFDVVYDFICYSPQNAKDILKAVATDRYIMISSYRVYGLGLDMKEEDFRAEEYKYIDADIETIQKIVGYKPAYKYGKQGAEAVIAQNKKFREIRVRLPIVLGLEDHLKRLDTYIMAIKDGKDIFVDNLDCRFSVIKKENGAKYLSSLKTADITGAINISDDGYLCVQDLIDRVEKVVGAKSHISLEGMSVGYNGFFNRVLNLDKLKGLNTGRYDNVNHYIDDLIVETYDRVKKISD